MVVIIVIIVYLATNSNGTPWEDEQEALAQNWVVLLDKEELQFSFLLLVDCWVI